MFKRNVSNTEVAALAAETVSRSAKWRKALIPLTTLAAAGALAVGSGADFSSQTVNPNSIVASGTMTQSNSKTGAAVFNVNNMKPGDVAVGDVTITNTGSLPTVFSLTESAFTSTFAAATSPATGAANLQLVVQEINPTTFAAIGPAAYTGNFGALGTKPLTTFVAASAHTFRFTVTFASTAGNSEQGKTASATYTWNGAQTSNVTITQGAGTAATATNANP